MVRTKLEKKVRHRTQKKSLTPKPSKSALVSRFGTRGLVKLARCKMLQIEKIYISLDFLAVQHFLSMASVVNCKNFSMRFTSIFVG